MVLSIISLLLFRRNTMGEKPWMHLAAKGRQAEPETETAMGITPVAAYLSKKLLK